MKTILLVAIIIILLVFTVTLCSACVVAGRADRQMENILKNREAEKGTEKQGA